MKAVFAMLAKLKARLQEKGQAAFMADNIHLLSRWRTPCPACWITLAARTSKCWMSERFNRAGIFCWNRDTCVQSAEEATGVN